MTDKMYAINEPLPEGFFIPDRRPEDPQGGGKLDPESGSVWVHSNGIRYTVLFLTNLDTQYPTSYPVTVVYVGPNGKLWSRPLHSWHRSMTLFGG